MPFLVVGAKYARAVQVSARAQPVVFPAALPGEIPALLELVDGVLLTGSASNVHPSHFAEEVADPTLPLDAERDALTLELVNACIKTKVPLLGVCRGFQEINVAMGGSLHQLVHAIPGYLDHREPKLKSQAEQYGPSHSITMVPGSILEQWANGREAKVNSLHGQGIARLGKGLTALAHAPDGLVEAFGVSDAKTFAYAVQWHPEWQSDENSFYSALFNSFGDACRMRQRVRLA